MIKYGIRIGDLTCHIHQEAVHTPAAVTAAEDHTTVQAGAAAEAAAAADFPATEGHLPSLLKAPEDISITGTANRTSFIRITISGKGIRCRSLAV